ncbi:MAG: DUF4956 domain-containing protein [Gammaproteobacteria bacterium]|nr:DUF4956 domain-containing protein [Gammaproteobacteria bacterium]
MRKSIGVAIPAVIITLYYVLTIGLTLWLNETAPGIRDYLPIGSITELVDDGNRFEVVDTTIEESGRYAAAIRLALGMLGAAVLMVPISWVYLITYGRKDIDQSFVQTMMILPLVVAGIAVIVQNSLALAFSLAGIVAAVRFRFTLGKPAHALYIFAAIGIGLAAGVGALGVGAVISIAFVYATLTLWKLDYGGNLRQGFLAFITRRDTDQDL